MPNKLQHLPKRVVAGRAAVHKALEFLHRLGFIFAKRDLLAVYLDVPSASLFTQPRFRYTHNGFSK